MVPVFPVREIDVLPFKHTEEAVAVAVPPTEEFTVIVPVAFTLPQPPVNGIE
jgi:hypothetical protein